MPAPAEVDVLEYGCGTGPAACFLASRGFRVHAVDLIPRAIALAREFARQRALDIRFDVQDMCALANTPAARQYDLVVDSFCLQSIVTDADRADLFAAVRARLAPSGHYLISTAMYEPVRDYGEGFRYDETTGVCREEVPDQEAGAHRFDGAVQIGGRWYRPHRRHQRPEALHAELTRAGFEVLSQESPFGVTSSARWRRDGSRVQQSYLTTSCRVAEPGDDVSAALISYVTGFPTPLRTPTTGTGRSTALTTPTNTEHLGRHSPRMLSAGRPARVVRTLTSAKPTSVATRW